MNDQLLVSRLALLLRALWLSFAGLIIGHGFWLRGHGGNLGEVTVVVFFWLMILGFPSAFVGYYLSFAMIGGLGRLADWAGVPSATWLGSASWLLLHVVTAGFGYWQWFVWVPRLRKGSRLK